MDQYLTLVVGFILTTVAGGFLGYWLQNRSWKHQHDAQLLQSERSTATSLFENISQLMDKRLYRMRLLAWSLEAETEDADAIEQHMQNYRQLLYDWNDTLIRNLAITQAYFGSQIREQIESVIYEDFSRIGRLLEKRYQAYQLAEPVSEVKSTELELRELGDQIYRVNFQMIRLIQKGQVGIFNHDTARD
jgi:hypothetical protein